MRAAVQRIGNSAGIILPKPVLTERGLSTGDALTLTLDGGKVILMPAEAHPRAGWADAAQAVSTDPEIQKTRPFVIVSPPEMHNDLRTVLAAPMTTGSRPGPFRVPLRFEEKSGLILLDQIRALDKQRLIRRLGALDRRTLRTVLDRLQDVFAE